MSSDIFKLCKIHRYFTHNTQVLNTNNEILKSSNIFQRNSNTLTSFIFDYNPFPFKVFQRKLN